MDKKDMCSIRTQMEEGDKVVEEDDDSTKTDTTKNNPMNTTSITSKTSQTREHERVVEGGATMPDRADNSPTTA
mgnify:CR=1 FL=1